MNVSHDSLIMARVNEHFENSKLYFPESRIGNHISKVKDVKGQYAHGYYWKTKNSIPNIDELKEKYS